MLQNSITYKNWKRAGRLIQNPNVLQSTLYLPKRNRMELKVEEGHMMEYHLARHFLMQEMHL